MLKDIHFLKNSTGIQMELEHPIEEIGKIPMFVWEIDEKDSYLFTIPFHQWSYMKEKDAEITIQGPSSFKYKRYQNELISLMKEAIDIIEKEHTH